MDSTVLVTGASGFLGSHCVKQLLEAGYQVRGTVRSLSNELKVKPIKDLDKDGRLELVEADLLKPDGWDKSVDGCKYVLHVASPVPEYGTADTTTITTAIEGTLHVLRAAGCCFKHHFPLYTPDKVFSEKDWASANGESYATSKVLSERAAWNFVKDNKGIIRIKCHNDNVEGHKFDLVVINPGIIFGPLLHRTYFTSADVIKEQLESVSPLTIDLWLPCCDVRDVAKAHLNAMTIPEAVNQRHIMAQQPAYSMQQLGKDLTPEFGPQGYRIPTKLMPNGVARVVLRVAGLFDKRANAIRHHIGFKWKLDTCRMKEVLGIQSPIDQRRSAIEMAYSLIDNGMVKRKPGYKSRKDFGTL